MTDLEKDLTAVLKAMVEIGTRRWRGLPLSSHEKLTLWEAKTLIAKAEGPK